MSQMRFAVLASGEGTNLQALLDATEAGRIRGEIVLVVSSREEAGAVVRARRAGVPVEVLKPADSGSSQDYSAELVRALKRAGADAVCLAGFHHHLEPALLRAFPNRVLNAHPALLPAFGGKGMYGAKVHEAALAAGVKVTGCTIHFVDDIYDHGPIVSQYPVPVMTGDTAATLGARVRAQMHWAYPEAVRLLSEGRLEVAGGVARVRPSPTDALDRVRRVLVSVHDKTGIVDFAKGLSELGAEVLATSGTAKAMRDAGVAARALDTVTGFPEILQGRVKTLHPKIHGGILLRRRDPELRREAELLGLDPIDMVVVNLYPMEEASAGAPAPAAPEALARIDVGGSALIRAAAKNFEEVAVVVSPADYTGILKELEASQGRLSLQTRRRLAWTAFRHTALYDQTVAVALREDVR